MIYPKPTENAEIWQVWVNKYAPMGGPSDPELPADLCYLCGIDDRELAASSAKGAVASLRERRMI